jgi:hypothetical protein
VGAKNIAGYDSGSIVGKPYLESWSRHYNTLIDVALNFSPFRRDYPASGANKQTAECLFHAPFDDRGKKTRHRSVQRYRAERGLAPFKRCASGFKMLRYPRILRT